MMRKIKTNLICGSLNTSNIPPSTLKSHQLALSTEMRMGLVRMLRARMMKMVQNMVMIMTQKENKTNRGKCIQFVEKLRSHMEGISKSDNVK